MDKNRPVGLPIDREEAAWHWYLQQDPSYPIDGRLLRSVMDWMTANPLEMQKTIQNIGPVTKWNYRTLYHGKAQDK